MQSTSCGWVWLAGVLVTFSSLFSFSGCASIVKGTAPQQVSFKTTPSDADCQISDLRTGGIILKQKSPILAQLKRESGYFKNARYRYSCEKEGYVPGHLDVESSANGWYVGGNFIFGGLIGWLIVDPATGAMWSFFPDDITLALALPVPVSSSAGGHGAVPMTTAYFQGIWIGTWENFEQEITITVGQRNPDGTFDTEYSWGHRSRRGGYQIYPGTVRMKGREDGEKFVFEFSNPNDFRTNYIAMTKYEGGKVKAKIDGLSHAEGGSLSAEGYLKRK